MIPVFIGAGILLLIYVAVVFMAAGQVLAHPFQSLENNTQSGLFYSVIVPFRNEREMIFENLKALKKLEFDVQRFEVIYIDDHSENRTADRLKKLLPAGFSLHRAGGNGKKNAIMEAVGKAAGNYIITLDADSVVAPDWLAATDRAAAQRQPALIVQPVMPVEGQGLCHSFQYYDALAMAGINLACFRGTGKPLLASGANLVFSREHFRELQPFRDNLAVASGDDMFLLRAFRQLPERKVILNYSPGTVVRTRAEGTWAGLLNQRIRWAGKMKHLKSTGAFLFGLLALLTQVALILMLVLSFFLEPVFAKYLVLTFILKYFADLALVKSTARGLGLTANGFRLLILEPVYAVFVPFTALLSLVVRPRWKGRKITH